MSEWRPIESLPITITPEDQWRAMHCLVWGKGTGIHIGRVWKHDAELCGVGLTNCGGEGIRDWGITHWMPLPEPPMLPGDGGR